MGKPRGSRGVTAASPDRPPLRAVSQAMVTANRRSPSWSSIHIVISSGSQGIGITSSTVKVVASWLIELAGSVRSRATTFTVTRLGSGALGRKVSSIARESPVEVKLTSAPLTKRRVAPGSRPDPKS